MKLNEATMNLLLKGFQTRLNEYGEKMRLYMKSHYENNISDADIYWEEASEIENELIQVLTDSLEEIKDK